MNKSLYSSQESKGKKSAICKLKTLNQSIFYMESHQTKIATYYLNGFVTCKFLFPT